jgi:hypothetical protein
MRCSRTAGFDDRVGGLQVQAGGAGIGGHEKHAIRIALKLVDQALAFFLGTEPSRRKYRRVGRAISPNKKSASATVLADLISRLAEECRLRGVARIQYGIDDVDDAI